MWQRFIVGVMNYVNVTAFSRLRMSSMRIRVDTCRINNAFNLQCWRLITLLLGNCTVSYNPIYLLVDRARCCRCFERSAGTPLYCAKTHINVPLIGFLGKGSDNPNVLLSILEFHSSIYHVIN